MNIGTYAEQPVIVKNAANRAQYLVDMAEERTRYVTPHVADGWPNGKPVGTLPRKATPSTALTATQDALTACTELLAHLGDTSGLNPASWAADTANWAAYCVTYLRCRAAELAQ